MAEAHTKTKKIVKRKLRWQGVIFLAFLCAVLYISVHFLLKVDISLIEVSGNEYVKDTQIIKAAGLNDDVTFLGFSAKDVCKAVLNDPLIKSCKIKRKLRFDVEIIVEENVPLFFYANENAIILSDGNRVAGTNNYGLPTLVNFVPEDILEKFITGLADIDSDIIRSISEIEYSPSSNANGTYIDKERFIFDMNDGNKVIINNKKMAVFNHYKKIYASIDKKGIFNFDCDFDNYLFSEYEE